MKVEGNNIARGVLAAFLLGLAGFVILVQYAPDSVAFSPNNYGWDGMQGVASTYNVNFTTSLSSVTPRSVLVVIQPSINFTDPEVKSIHAFLVSGGTLLVADKSGVANSLLTPLGVGVTIANTASISDHTYNWKSQSVPTALVLPGAKSRFRFLANATGIALSSPAPLVTRGADVVDLAITSQFSRITSLTTIGLREVNGPFVVMAAQRISNGTVVVVGDSQFLLNSEWTIANNRVLIGNLFSKTNVFVDASHWGASSIAQLKSQLRQFYAFVSASPMRYIVTLFMVGLALALVPEVGPFARPTPFNDRGEG